MKRFAELYRALDETTKTSVKVAAMENYFRSSPPEDCAWAVFFLCGGKLRAPFPSRLFRTWSAEAAGMPEWIFDESYDAAGDLAETAALLWPEPGAQEQSDLSLAQLVETKLIPLRKMPEAEQRAVVVQLWRSMGTQQRFVWNKLITGAFRVGVSKALVIRAVARVAGIDEDTIAHRLMGDWSPSAEAWHQLMAKNPADAHISRPYPFYLAYPLDAPPETLGDIAGWVAEWKWDGIRAQLIRRGGGLYVWSRGGDLITERFPELEILASKLPDGAVLDGELVGWKNSSVLPFADLQQRIGRKLLGQGILSRVPVTLLAFDVLEWNGEDIRAWPLRERRRILEGLNVPLSPVVEAASWEDIARQRDRARDMAAEGLMLKRAGSPYGVGREKGAWWKWKVDPYSVDAVLIYAQRGNGKRASLFTDYTFGVWDDSKLVPFAKAYSGLTDEEIRQVDAFIRRNTVEKYGPVCTVKPELVFEIAFEGIQRSTRHKSGVAVRFPRMSRWRTDKRPEDADSIETVKALLP